MVVVCSFRSWNRLFLLFLCSLLTITSAAISYDTPQKYLKNATAPPLVNDNPSADAGKSWSTNINATFFKDGSSVRPILLRRSSRKSGPGLSFACGFYCNGTGNTFLFAVFWVRTDENSTIIPSNGSLQVVWSANRNNIIEGNATLRFMANGDLTLIDAGGRTVWSTNTSNGSVVRMNLNSSGNLILRNSSGGIVWQSFEHPTDTILPGQSLTGRKLFSNVSDTNSSEGTFYLDVTANSFRAYTLEAPQFYYSEKDIEDGVLLPVNLDPGSLVTGSIHDKWHSRFLRFEVDGHLRLHEWSEDHHDWRSEQDELSVHGGDCGYPTFCGNYSLCRAKQCSCVLPDGQDRPYFKAKNPKQPNDGCSEVRPLSCQDREHRLLPYGGGLYFFGYAQATDVSLQNITLESCKEACSKNCSCRAAFFKYRTDEQPKGDCYLPSTILSVYEENQSSQIGYNSTAFIKVKGKGTNGGQQRHVVIGTSLGIFFFFVLVCLSIALVLLMKKKKRKMIEGLELQFKHLPGMLTRFSYKELKLATKNFSTKLGEGGFGSVFEGTLNDGMRVAVKLLGYEGQGMKEFVAEVETIGSIHHVSLVRLVGYCAHKLHRLLVYEFMSNGSLEKWIFHGIQTPGLDWKTKSNIILDVAKGLMYLHEQCRHRIIHLDIKPQNILLDDNFNAKVSDFGLSKLVDRNQSRVFTTLRGTRGYLAPEWLGSLITEKVDVYSFGVVVLEMVCERRSLDDSRAQSSIHLATVLKKAIDENRLLDMIDKDCNGVDYSNGEALKMLRLVIWCLQGDYSKRPSMSTVVKVLEGVMDVEPMALDLFPPSVIMDYSSSTISTLSLSSTSKSEGLNARVIE